MAKDFRLQVARSPDQFFIHADNFAIANTRGLRLFALLFGNHRRRKAIGLAGAAINFCWRAAEDSFAGMLRCRYRQREHQQKN